MNKKSLFENFSLGGKWELKNRFVMAPMTTWSGSAEGFLSAEEKRYYQARSKSAALVITAACAIDINGQAFQGQISARSDAFLPSLIKLASCIQKEGGKAILQIHHGGRMCPEGLNPNAEVVSASTIPAERPQAALPRELSNEEIEKLIDTHVEVTQRAYQAGFDGVELHGANTYLLQQFVSPHSNRRNDKWGGSLENRMKFPLQIVEKLSQAIAQFEKPFILGYRFSPEEMEEPGLTIDDTCVFIDRLANTDLDYLHISLPHFKASSLRNVEDKSPVVNKITETLQGRKPLIGVGSIKKREDAQEAFDMGYDMVALGSILLSNPDGIEYMQEDKPLALELYEEECLDKCIPKPMFKMLYQLNQLRGNWPGITLKK